MFLLIGPSPKRRDLLRDGRFALHSFPSPQVDDEFYLTGTVLPEYERGVTARNWPPEYLKWSATREPGT